MNDIKFIDWNLGDDRAKSYWTCCEVEPGEVLVAGVFKNVLNDQFRMWVKGQRVGSTESTCAWDWDYETLEAAITDFKEFAIDFCRGRSEITHAN